MASFGSVYSYPNNPRVAKIQAVANLNGLKIDTPEFQLGQDNRTPDFLSKYPLGKVPTFLGADGTAIADSDAIAQYVAESGPASAQLLGATPVERATVRQWICLAESEIFAPVIDIFVTRIGLRKFDEKVENAALVKLERAVGTLETHLQGRTWAATDKLDLADISLAAALVWGFQFAIDAEMRPKYPLVVAWFEKVTGSEGVKQAFGEPKFVEKRTIPQ